MDGDSVADEMIGQRFGKLVVRERIRHGCGVRTLCDCDCVRTLFVKKHRLLRGDKKSCGCAAGKPSGLRLCQKCDKHKPLDEFDLKSVCRTCHGVPVVFRKVMVSRLIEVISERCGCMNPGCRWTGPVPKDALDFHHKNPADKKFVISNAAKYRQIDETVAEIEKCITMCANCHRLFHRGDFSVDEIDTIKISKAELCDADKFARSVNVRLRRFGRPTLEPDQFLAA